MSSEVEDQQAAFLERLIKEQEAEGELKHVFVDLRPKEAFGEGHVVRSANLPLELLAEQLYRLPPRGTPLVLIAASHEDLEKGRGLVEGSYPVPATLTWTPSLSSLFSQHSLLGTGVEGARLWQPNEFLLEYHPLLQPPSSRTAIDIAAGSGRDAVWLAVQGWATTAVDHMPDLLAKAEELAKAEGVEVRTVTLDLEREYANPTSSPTNPNPSTWTCPECSHDNPSPSPSPSPSPQSLVCSNCSMPREEAVVARPPSREGNASPDPNPDPSPSLTPAEALQQLGHFDLVHVSRYLHRDLFPVLRDVVRSQGYLIYSTFMHPSMGRPRRERFLLKAGELRALAEGWGWEVVDFKETHLPDGRPFQAICARKP